MAYSMEESCFILWPICPSSITESPSSNRQCVVDKLICSESVETVMLNKSERCQHFWLVRTPVHYEYSLQNEYHVFKIVIVIVIGNTLIHFSSLLKDYTTR